MDKPAEHVLLVEYEKAQDSARFHDGLVWTSTGITWALSVLLLGFSINSVTNRIAVAALFVTGVCLILFQWKAQAEFRHTKNQKYVRCKEIEGILGMEQHTRIVREKATQTFYYRLISICMIAAWTAILVFSWTKCK